MIGTTLADWSRRCPWGLAGMIALVLLVEGAIDRRSASLFDMEDIAFRWTGQAATSEAKGAQVLCFGDSLIKLSVVPAVVQERLGKQVYNLGLSGSQAPTSYFLLKRALDAGARPEAVVVDFNPPLLRVGPRHITTRWGALIHPFEAAELARWSDDPDLFGAVALDHYLLSLRGKTTIRTNIMEALAGRSTTNLSWNELAVRNWSVNGGAQMMVGMPSPADLAAAEVRRLREGYYPEWSCHPANRSGIKHFLDLASKHKIRVFWLLAPLVPALHDEIERSGIDARHEAFVRSWQANYPNIVILDARKKVAEIAAFWDPQHLSVIGASAFSRTLGDVLRRSIHGQLDPQWVALPDVKIGPLAPGIETLIQSRFALDAASKARR